MLPTHRHCPSQPKPHHTIFIAISTPHTTDHIPFQLNSRPTHHTTLPPKHQPASQPQKMKLLTLNFLTCARKACKQEPSAFPLHPRDAELERVDQEVNPEFLVNVLPRLDWKAIRSLSEEVMSPQTSNLLARHLLARYNLKG
jgi:hypothetical protein